MIGVCVAQSYHSETMYPGSSQVALMRFTHVHTHMESLMRMNLELLLFAC